MEAPPIYHSSAATVQTRRCRKIWIDNNDENMVALNAPGGDVKDERTEDSNIDPSIVVEVGGMGSAETSRSTFFRRNAWTATNFRYSLTFPAETHAS